MFSGSVVRAYSTNFFFFINNDIKRIEKVKRTVVFWICSQSMQHQLELLSIMILTGSRRYRGLLFAGSVVRAYSTNCYFINNDINKIEKIKRAVAFWVCSQSI